MTSGSNKSLVLIGLTLTGVNALAVACTWCLSPAAAQEALPAVALAVSVLTVIELAGVAALWLRVAPALPQPLPTIPLLEPSPVRRNQSHGTPKQMGTFEDVLRLTYDKGGLSSSSGEIRAELLEHAFSTVPYRVFWKDANSVYQGCNQNFLKDIGVSSLADVVGKSDFDMPWQSIGDECQADDREVLDSGIPKYQYEVQIAGADGDLSWLLVSKVPIRDRDRVIGVLGSYDNITSRKRAEEERDSLRLYLREVFDSMPSALVGVDSRGNVTEWNTAAERFTGTSASRAFGKPLAEAFPLLPDALPAMLAAIEGRKAWAKSRIPAKVTDGDLCCDVMVYPLSGGNGAVIRVDDVTELAQKEDLLRQAQKMESVGQLAGGLAHDFNNSLVGIRGGLSLMRSRLQGQAGVKPGQLLDLVELAETGTNHATEMVRRLLTLSRKQQPSFEDLDLRVAVGNVMRICETTFPSQIKLQTDLHPSPLIVHADRVQLEQALLNLALNAKDAITATAGESKSSWRLTVSARPVDADDARFSRYFPEAAASDYVAVRVQDTGVGMDAATSKKIFDPFFTTKAQSNGTGLGLSMVASIVKHHQGAVDVVSALGQGTTMTLYFARKQGVATLADPPERAEARAGSGLVLVADDHENVRKTLGIMLRESGYDVVYASDGEEAVRVVRERKSEISAVILDMRMPKCSGREAFLSMREIVPSLQVLVSSGQDSEDEVQEMLALGARDFLRKPFSPAELTRRLEIALAGPRGCKPELTVVAGASTSHS